MSPQDERAKAVIERMMEQASTDPHIVRPCSQKEAEWIEDFCKRHGRTLEQFTAKLVELGARRHPDSIILPTFQFSRRVWTPEMEKPKPKPALPPPPPPEPSVGDQLGFAL